MAKLETKIYDARISDLTETEHNPRQISKTISRSLWTRKARLKMTTTNKTLDAPINHMIRLGYEKRSARKPRNYQPNQNGFGGGEYNLRTSQSPSRTGNQTNQRQGTGIGEKIQPTTAFGFVRLNVPVIIITRTMPKKCGTFLSIRTGNFVWCPYRGWV